MVAPRPVLAMTSLLLYFGLARAGAAAEAPGAAEEYRVTLTGTVRMPDGSPESGATVQVTDGMDEGPLVARTDRNGRFQVRGVFGNGADLHARSADGNLQTTSIIPSIGVRTACANPIEMTLAPAIRHEVVVRAGERPVEGAEVVASGIAFIIHGVTGPDGKVTLRLPAGDRLQEVAAWHRRLGVRGVRDLDHHPARDRTELALMPPGPLWIHAVDPDGHPVPGLELGISVRTDRDWAVVSRIPAARVHTGADGTAIVPWAPREKLGAVDPDIISPDWKLDRSNLELTSDRVRNRIVTIKVRRKVSVNGRLALPAGASPEGLLITGFGFGPENRGDVPYARVRSDGSFTLRIASEHGYVLGATDLEWAGDTWSGQILAKGTTEPVEIRMSGYRTTPLAVRVTRGPRREPIADAWVEVGSIAEVNWVDAGGKERSGRAGIHTWLQTDRDGLARAGAARGKYKVRLVLPEWDGEQAIDVTSDQPVEMEFHRP